MIIVSVFAADYDRRQRARVWLDGVEVTADCQTAVADEPDEGGAVLLLLRDGDGNHYVDATTGDPAREWRHGRVEIRREDR
jgi:hypothetical protein